MTKTPAELTPVGRYLVARGRLWRTTDPSLNPIRRQQLVDNLMHARRAVRQALRADDPLALHEARAQVQAAKEGLGERGSVWWTDGAPDYNRHLIKNTPYAGVYLTRQLRSSD
jgi:hypothetical protein